MAGVEQIIAAVDTLKGDTGWRRKTTLLRARPECGYLRDLVSYTILGEESRVEGLVHAALEAGAGGATVSDMRAAGRVEKGGPYISRARHASDLVIPEARLRAVHRAVISYTEGGPYPSEFIEVFDAEKASRYRHRQNG